MLIQLTPAMKSTQYLFQRLVDHEAPVLGELPMPNATLSGIDFYLDKLANGQAATAAMRTG